MRAIYGESGGQGNGEGSEPIDRLWRIREVALRGVCLLPLADVSKVSVRGSSASRVPRLVSTYHRVITRAVNRFVSELRMEVATITGSARRASHF